MGGMKVKTSVTLPEDVIGAIDIVVPPYRSRSEVIELAVREFLVRRERQAIDARDLEILDLCADRLNDEAADVLTFQVDL